MRILLVTHRFPPDGVAGVERVTQALARELAGRGDSVAVVTRKPDDSRRDPRLEVENAGGGITIYRMVGGGAGVEVFLRHQHRLDELFERVVREVAPDVTHVHHLLDLSPGFFRVSHAAGAPVVLTLHDYYFACPYFQRQLPEGRVCAGPDGGRACAATCFASEGEPALLRWGLRNIYFSRLMNCAQRVVCPSHYVARYFAGQGLESSRSRVIPNGLVARPPSPGVVRRTRRGHCKVLRLAFLGSITAAKGPQVILEAIRLAGLGGVHLRLLGQASPPFLSHLRRLATELPGCELGTYGPYEPPELDWLLADVDAVVIPSLWPETFSLVAREAFTRGVPVLASKLGALPEAVEGGKNGFLFDPRSPAELARLLQKLAWEPGLIDHLRTGAGATPVLSARDHAALIRQVYEEVIREFRADAEDLLHLRTELGALEAMLVRVGFAAA